MSAASKARRRMQKLDTAARDKRLLEMVKSGATWQAMSDALGFGGPSNAIRAFKRLVLTEGPTESSKEEARTIAQMRMNALLLAVWPQAVKGSLPHWEKAQRALERYIQFWGLDAPRQQHNTDIHLEVDTSTLTDEQINQLRRGILPASLAGRSGDGVAPQAEGPEPGTGGEEPPGDMGG